MWQCPPEFDVPINDLWQELANQFAPYEILTPKAIFNEEAPHLFASVKNKNDPVVLVESLFFAPLVDFLIKLVFFVLWPLACSPLALSPPSPPPSAYTAGIIYLTSDCRGGGKR